MIADILKKLQAKHTPEFDFTPPLPPEGATASERFENFHQKNPHIFENLRNLAEYEGHVDVEERLVRDVVAVCETVAATIGNMTQRDSNA